MSGSHTANKDVVTSTGRSLLCKVIMQAKTIMSTVHHFKFSNISSTKMGYFGIGFVNILHKSADLEETVFFSMCLFCGPRRQAV